MTIHVYLLFPETAGKPLEEITEMFKNPNGIKYLGIPAWRTKNYYSTTVRMEHGEGVGKVVDEERSPERMSSAGQPEEEA